MSSMTTKQDPTLEELQARRRELAFQVAQGRTEFEPELDAVEDAVDRLRRQQERQRLAGEETRARQEGERQAQAEIERKAKEGRLAALHTARRRVAGELEVQVDRLVHTLDEYGQLGREIYALDAELSAGRPRAKLLGIEQAANFLAWRLADRLPLGARPAHESRRPLRELLGYTDEPQPPQVHDFTVGEGV